MRRAAILAVATLSTLGAACSDDDGLSADGQRYCELTAQVEAKSEQAFAGLSDDASEQDVAAAQQGLLADIEDDLDTMVEIAPPDIAQDVKAFVPFVKAQLRGEDAAEASDTAILEWEEEHCDT